SITTFSIATTNGYKGKDGNWINETTWHNIVSFNLSDYFKENLKKGKKVYVEGRLTKREYTDKEGIKRYSTDVVLEKLITLDAAGEGAHQSYSADEAGKSVNEPNMNVEENDDLPF
ncbi:MAG: single-stranded DNA-binding protein, partial [Ignavibacteriaceae bacterium]|nr:single-stranded DNA-binding protein [Ignavibacteriaceae bacterium]